MSALKTIADALIEQQEHGQICPTLMDALKAISEDDGELLDSVEVGTPSKGGALKVYFNAANKEDAEKRLRNGNDMRKLAQELIQ